MSDPLKPWEEPIRYSHQATTPDNPPYPGDSGDESHEVVSQGGEDRGDEVFGVDEDEDEVDSVEVPEDEIGENGRIDYEDLLDDDEFDAPDDEDDS